LLIVATLFGDNYFELLVNGRFVKADPIQFVPHQAVQFTFSVDTSKPVEYAIYVQDYMQDSTGLEYDHTALGDGSFLAYFSDGTVTNAQWKYKLINNGPIPSQCCYEWDGSKNCNGNLTCATTEFSFDEDWYTAGYDFSDWSSVSIYTVDTVGWGTPSVYDPLTSTCIVAIPNWKDDNIDYTTPNECKNPAIESSLGSFHNAEFIWGPDIIQNNHLLLRYTQPATSSSYSIDPNANCPVCTAPYTNNQRIRREIRQLSSSEWQKVVDAYWIMKNTPQEEGEAKYGPYYKQFDYFPSKHAVTTTDSRGDQGHFSAAFMTWHSAFLLEFENSLLSIDPSIGALPYWDSTITEPSIYTNQYFGSCPGKGENGQVNDGKFANWPIKTGWSLSTYDEYIDDPSTIAFQNSDSGYLRNADNTNDNPFVTRFGTQYSYDSEDFDDCRMLQGYWNDWFECIELGSVRGKRVVDGVISHHSGPHLQMGGAEGTDGGDFMDVVTSPNEPLFMFHHANMDRSKMWYMLNNANKGNIFYGFPVKNSASIPGGIRYDGINLNDVMASAWGFTGDELGLNVGHDGLLTHADALCYLAPFTAPYTYDDMADLEFQTTHVVPDHYGPPPPPSDDLEIDLGPWSISEQNDQLVIVPTTVASSLVGTTKIVGFYEFAGSDFNKVPTQTLRKTTNLNFIREPVIHPAHPELCEGNINNCFKIRISGDITDPKNGIRSGAFSVVADGGYNPSETKTVNVELGGGEIYRLAPLGVKFDADFSWNSKQAASSSMLGVQVELDWTYTGSESNPQVKVTPIINEFQRTAGFTLQVGSSSMTVSFPGVITATNEAGVSSYLDGNMVEDVSKRQINGKNGKVVVYVLFTFKKYALIQMDPVVEVGDLQNSSDRDSSRESPSSFTSGVSQTLPSLALLMVMLLSFWF
jgi:hypothetical protein